MRYTPSDWYWSGTIGIYGSARAGLVATPASDTAYQAWLQTGAKATPWPGNTAAALDAVLAAAGLPPTGLTPPTQAQLIAYANSTQWGLATGGFTVTIASTACTFKTDDVSTGLITGKAVRLSQLSPPATINWQFVSGYVLITATEFIAAATQIADFVQATFDSLESVLASIASGAITTTAQVDSAAWPSNVSAVPIS